MNQKEKKINQPNYLVINIQKLNEAAKYGSLPCFIGNVNTKGKIIVKPYTINSAVSNLPVSGLNQLQIQHGFQLLKAKDMYAITERDAKKAGTEIDHPEKGYIGITKKTSKGNYVVEKMYPLSKAKDISKIKKYSKEYIANKENKSNIKLERNEQIQIDCTKVKNFNEYWGKYKTAATAKGVLVCSPESIELARKSLVTNLENMIENADYNRNNSIGKELDKSYQKELREAFPRPVSEQERQEEREKRYEQAYKFDGIDR